MDRQWSAMVISHWWWVDYVCGLKRSRLVRGAGWPWMMVLYLMQWSCHIGASYGPSIIQTVAIEGLFALVIHFHLRRSRQLLIVVLSLPFTFTHCTGTGGCVDASARTVQALVHRRCSTVHPWLCMHDHRWWDRLIKTNGISDVICKVHVPRVLVLVS